MIQTFKITVILYFNKIIALLHFSQKKRLHLQSANLGENFMMQKNYKMNRQRNFEF